MSAFETQVKKKQQTIEKLQVELDEARETIYSLKMEIEKYSLKVIEMEESIYEMENIQLDLVNQLKDLELANENAEDRIEKLIKACEDLEKG